jgi:ATP-dependent helicase HepA
LKIFLIGQRWISESEPELGLGVIVEVESKTLVVFFPATNVERRYGTQTAPLRRLLFQAMDEIRLIDGSVHVVESVKEQAGQVSYVLERGVVIPEIQLSPTHSLSRPEERLFAGSLDSNEMFKLRYDVMLNQRKLFTSPVRGYIGGRLSLIPHQFYVANEVAGRPRPRVMLADEVGLGKTIEAGLILNRLLLTGLAERVLIVVPDSLVYQWFVEMLKKFGLSFATINFESKIEEGSNPFNDGQLFIASLKYLQATPWLQEFALQGEWDMLAKIATSRIGVS